MAAISKSLAKSLDSLRATIIAAEDKLASIPGASHPNLNVRSISNDDEENQCFLQVEVNGKNARIMAIMWDPREEVEVSSVHILDLPVHQRVFASQMIPYLIREAKKFSESLVGEIELVISEIQTEIES